MRITKVYTRGGDKGQTSLVGGDRVPKNHVRITAYGTVDELNAVIGLTRTFNGRSGADAEKVARIETMLHRVQNDLFNVGTDLATPAKDRWPGMFRVGGDEVERLEGWIDELNEDLGPLKEFILPGGGPVGAFFHQARTVCRRAEREVITLMESDDEVGDGPMKYLNRLSDYLFVAGRWAAQALGEPEYLWDRPK
ncbi:MAG: cob(I)yrinic acid a,c-diamide adenosyltransferase [Deltaproteobacteria bacterium]|nr:cob(I)yrinic acid a,c-diamide adenosyltransferase [Deltaproteobacteria bacterium]